ncbi:unnamed protein product [marine sediment metagenome]|uniref:Uncharacterized protein n=1 Tax=marine sediment metagenome TaxID=412755 RepID=X0TMR2_9ZZZZ
MSVDKLYSIDDVAEVHQEAVESRRKMDKITRQVADYSVAYHSQERMMAEVGDILSEQLKQITILLSTLTELTWVIKDDMPYK